MQRLSSVVKDKVEAYVVSGVQEERKIELLDNLSIAVEKIQNKFENPIHNKVVKDGREVENLCSCLEDIFQHGIREKLFQSSVNSAENVSFWEVVQKLSMKEDIQSIYRLSIIQTEVNRCRAWICMKLKDHTIGSYIGLLTENSKLLKEHYSSNAFLRDPLKTESVRTLLQYVIASLDFYISVETPRHHFDQIAVDTRPSSGFSSPDTDTARPDFQHGEIVKRRRSSKKRAKNPLAAAIAPIREFDSVSNVSSDHSSGRSSRNSSVPSPITESTSQSAEVKIRFLEGSLINSEKMHAFVPNSRLENAKFNDKTSDLSLETGGNGGDRAIQMGDLGNRLRRAGSSCSSRSRSSNDSSKEFDSSLSKEILQKSKKTSQIIESMKREGLTEGSKSGEVWDESSPPRKSSTPLHEVLTQKQKDEIAEMMGDLKSKSNRPLTTEKVIEIIPIQDGMSIDEIKGYINECLKDYFSTGIITTRGISQQSVKSPVRRQLDLGAPLNSEQQQAVDVQSKVGNELERKRSLEEFIRRGRTEPPYWSSIRVNEIETAPDMESSNTKSASEENETVSNLDLNSSSTINGLSTKSLRTTDSESCEQPSTQSKRHLESCGVDGNPNVVEKASDASVNKPYLKAETLNDKEAIKRVNEANIEYNWKCLESAVKGEDNLESDDSKRDFFDACKELSSQGQESVTLEETSSLVTAMGNQDECIGINAKASEDASESDVEMQKRNDETAKLKLKRMEKQSHANDFENDGDRNDVIVNGGLEGEKVEDSSAVGGGIFDDASYLEASAEMNFVPGICEQVSIGKHSNAKPIRKLRKANTIGPARMRRITSPKVKGTKSLNAKSSSSGETGDLLYGFKMNSPTIAYSTTSSIDTNQGYMFDDNDCVSDSEGETCTSEDVSEKEKIRSLLADLGVNDDIIGMKENHFSTPESFMGFTSDEELENAIETCKERIKSLAADSEERKHLVKKLVQLRLKRHEQKEAPPDDAVNTRKILGHRFVKEGKVSGNYFCDCCGTTIWALLHTLYKCNDCSFHCHRKCLASVDKSCVSKKVSGSVYITDISPESGLSTQQYRCADCRRRFLFRDGSFQARICDYTGQFYCSNCHWNETQVVPARVVHNWDFTPKKVSRQSKHLLNLLSSKPILCVREINPALFNFVEDLRDVRALREHILEMKRYLLSCRIAIEGKLLLMLKDRQHFVENAHMYTMQDLVTVDNGKLLEELSQLTATFGKHIKFDCPICQGRGFICEICPSSDVIFPFDFNATACRDCTSLFHRSCYRKGSCPKCKRINSRQAQNKSTSPANFA